MVEDLRDSQGLQGPADLQGLAARLGSLQAKGKEPFSARVLDKWVEQAQAQLGTRGPRLGWLIAATVVTGVLQRACVAGDGKNSGPFFLLKGGTMLQYRLGDTTRNTRDVDGLVRTDFATFFNELDKVLVESWGPFDFSRTEAEVIAVPGRVLKPRRFDVLVSIKGVTWCRVQVEISADEGDAGRLVESVAAPSLAGFGVESPARIATLSMSYQIAQKVHAVTGPHQPPELVNDRSRDVVDLLLLRDLVQRSGAPELNEIAAAIHDVFEVRAREAANLGVKVQTWPARVVAWPHWETSFTTESEGSGVNGSLQECVEELNIWLCLVDEAS